MASHPTLSSQQRANVLRAYRYRSRRDRQLYLSYARRTGLVFVGKTRYGKRTCALAVQQYLLQEFPRIHVIVVPAFVASSH